ERLGDPARPAVVGEGVGPRGAEDRPASGQDPAHLGNAERPAVALERAAPSVAVADELVPEDFHALAHDRPDHRVQPRTVTTAGEYDDPHAPTLCSRVSELRASAPRRGSRRR